MHPMPINSQPFGYYQEITAKSDLKQNTSTHHIHTTVQVSDSDRELSPKRDLETHTSAHQIKTLACLFPSCLDMFATKSELETHYRKTHYRKTHFPVQDGEWLASTGNQVTKTSPVSVKPIPKRGTSVTPLVAATNSHDNAINHHQ